MQERGRGEVGAAGPNMSSSSSSNGWPLGLQPLHVHSQSMMMSRAPRSREQQHFFTFMNHHHQGHHHHQQLRWLQGDVSPFFLSTCTPSISSLSSSDLDTESTGSFFPERSTTLGTLIGIHARAQRNQPVAMDNATAQLLQSKHMTKAQRLYACWSACTWVLKCACSSSDENQIQESLSPYSLAHLLELERTAAHTHPQEGATTQCETYHDDEDNDTERVEESSHCSRDATLFQGVGECSHQYKVGTNTLFDDDGILPPNPSGAPLKVALGGFTSTTPSAYLSADWIADVPRKQKHYHSNHGRSHNSLCPNFWR